MTVDAVLLGLGAISDRIGRKRVVYVANTVIALTAIGFIYSLAAFFLLLAAALLRNVRGVR